MIYLEECFINVYGISQYKTLYKGNNFFEAEKLMKQNKTKNRLEIYNSNTGALIACKIAE